MGQTERLKLSNDNKNEEDDEYECQICNANLYVSLLADMEEETTYCLTHGIEHLTGHKELMKNCKLMYTHTRDEIKEIIRKLQDRLDEEEYAEEPKDDNSPPNDDEVDDAIEEEVEEVVDELKDQETFEALISEVDEVVRPPSKRKQPKIRKRSSGSDEDSDESIQEIKPDKNPATKNTDKNKTKGRRIEQPKLQDKR